MRPKFRMWMDMALEIIRNYSKVLFFHKIFIILFIHISFHLQNWTTQYVKTMYFSYDSWNVFPPKEYSEI